MMFQSEAQFLNNYGGRRTVNDGRHFTGRPAAEESSMWDKLSRIFTFGCIEANHNSKV